MVPTQVESLSHWNVVCFTVCYYFQVLHMSDQNTTMLAQPLHMSDICQITYQQL